jgi:tol-pal system protein YbgF
MSFLKKILKPFVIISMALVCFSFVEAPAMAQSAKEFRQIKKDIRRFQKEMRAVQRRVFDGEIPAEFMDAEALERQKSQQALLSNLTIKLSRLEREFSKLVGKIEELEYAQRQSTKARENFTKDVEMQIADLRKLIEGSAKDSTDGSASPSAGEGVAVAETGSAANPQEETQSSEADTDAVSSETLDEEKNENALEEPPAIPVLPEGSVEDKYNFARQLLRRGDYASAETAFLAFMKVFGNHELAPNAQYWLGETYYARKDFPKALEAFYNGYQKYSDGPKGPDSLLKLGLTLGNMGEKAEACSAFTELENHYPSLSRNIIRRLSAERGRLGCTG